MTPSIGILYGLGVGPGDPKLITVKALEQLQASPVVAFPAGLRGELGVAERIILPWLKDSQQRLPLHFPYVQDPFQLALAWQQAAETVWSQLSKGTDVTFACEGDISFYGTFTYLCQSLLKQHPQVSIEVIPGVASPMAAAAALGIPLTCQAQRLAVLPALYRVGELEAALSWAEVIVLMKVASVYEQVWKILARHHLLKTSYVVAHACSPSQKIYADLRDYPHLKLPYFSLLIIRRPNRDLDSHCP